MKAEYSKPPFPAQRQPMPGWTEKTGATIATIAVTGGGPFL